MVVPAAKAVKEEQAALEERIFGEAGRQTVRTVKTALMARRAEIRARMLI